MNEDRNAKIGGAIPGFVKSIGKTIGDEVAKGEAVATIDRNLANQRLHDRFADRRRCGGADGDARQRDHDRVGFVRDFGSLDGLGRTRMPSAPTASA